MAEGIEEGGVQPNKVEANNLNEAASPMAEYLHGELRRLIAEWPALVAQAPPLPTFTWEDLIENLLEKAPTSIEEMVIRGATAALLKMSPFKPRELILREILVLTSSTFDLVGRSRQEDDMD